MRSLVANAVLTALLSIAVSTQALVAASTDAASVSDGEIGLRIDSSDTAAISAVSAAAVREIDYGTFRWIILPRTAYEQAVANGAVFSYAPVDYRITLGEQTFDPTRESPSIPSDLTATGGDGISARLIQVVGPTRPEWIDAMASADIQVVQYIHPFTYVVWSDAASIERLGKPEWLRWSGVFEPAYALLPTYRGLTQTGVDSRVLVIAKADQEAIRNAIAAAGGTQQVSTAISSTFSIIRFTIDGNRFADIARIPGVYSVKPIPQDGGVRGEVSCLVNVNSTDGTNRATGDYPTWLNLVGLDGTGVTIANVDGGCQQNHTELVSRILPCTGTTCTGNSPAFSHGTHTAGIMAADGSTGAMDAQGFLRGLGVAPGANLVIQHYSPHFANPGGMLALMKDSYNNGASLSGNSWGPAGSPLGYDDDTMQVDVGVRDADAMSPGDQPLTYVLSIMNGYGSNFQGNGTQGTPDEAKNLIAVGSTVLQNNDGSQNLNINDVSANSAHGPCLDGRKLPQIVAPGCNVESTVPTNTQSVFNWCGTSMASPQVSGGVALFIEHYRLLPSYTTDPSPSLVKAAVLAVARTLEGHLDADGAVMGPPFDSRQGYGRFDLEALVAPQDNVLYFDQQVVFDATGEEWSVAVEPANASRPMRIMLVWTDAPGHGLGGSTPAWNNNLDLIVEAGANTYRGNQIASGGFSSTGGTADAKNNTEAVFLGPTSPAAALIRVSASNISSNGLPNSGDQTDQDFSLVCYNCVAAPVEPVCGTILGDLDASGVVNGADVGEFVSCYTNGDPLASGCGCADMNDSYAFEQADIDAFVSCLLGNGCP